MVTSSSVFFSCLFREMEIIGMKRVAKNKIANRIAARFIFPLLDFALYF